MRKLPVLSINLIEAAKRSDGILNTLKIEEIEKIAERYRKFLYLSKQYPSVPITPTFDIDEMWHLHMLHPRHYYNDCMNLFGDIMDHNAGFGKLEEEIPVLYSYGDKTAEIWRQEFQEDYNTELSKKMRDRDTKDYKTCFKDPSAKDYKTCYNDPFSKDYKTCFKKASL